MDSIKVHLFMCFNSRGGTTAIEADTRAEAELIYQTKVYLYEDDDIDQAEGQSIEEARRAFFDSEYAGEFTLMGDNIRQYHDRDIEYDTDKVVLQSKTMPVLLVADAAPHLEDEDGYEDDSYTGYGGEGNDEDNQKLPDYPNNPGFVHPRWEDDAYSFALRCKE